MQTIKHTLCMVIAHTTYSTVNKCSNLKVSYHIYTFSIIENLDRLPGYQNKQNDSSYFVDTNF